MGSIGWSVRVGMAAGIAVLAGSALSGQRAIQAFRTPDGQPDLQGVWRAHTITPLERPAELVDKPFLTPEEASAYQARRLATLNLDTAPERAGLNGPSVNEFWSGDRGELAVLAGRIPTSLVVDPADGRIPPPTSARRAKLASRLEVRRQGASAAAFNTSERCLRDGGAPLFGSPDRGLIEIIQTNTHVVIRQENLHDTRVIPLDGRPHAGALVRAHMGDARGRFRADTLIVETTNFRDESAYRGANPARLRLTEEFTPQPDGKLTWSVTVNDSSTWTASWTFSMALTPDSGERILEYACHEGNRAMSNSLSAARAEERAGTR